ncbi:hypothetical protein T484DRAFT_1831679 [Baffinella frigidus]|nr:hypothetical protein T484DRAFT_1831679 [Cryptophyta sp. CCMP2293]
MSRATRIVNAFIPAGEAPEALILSHIFSRVYQALLGLVTGEAPAALIISHIFSRVALLKTDQDTKIRLAIGAISGEAPAALIISHIFSRVALLKTDLQDALLSQNRLEEEACVPEPST